ncbi:putative sodium-dependent multivitamin transporter isoform X1 [Parasteatoda tepidariorum]|uniref:putative sodium-dependent multivitamin transporter isoform X1 n=1 Tax=Parasteatoda tepidariorum TaxID=114398 RepID=UPI0039BC9E42
MVKHHLGITDYVVIGVMLLISVGIGVVAKYYGSQKSAREYLLAGKQMAKLPVMLSIIATGTSSTSLIGAPADIYKYGLAFISSLLLYPLGLYLASSIFIPVYYQCGVSTVNEFIEMRFGKIMKFMISTFLLLQLVVYMAVALYGSVLAFSAVTDLPLQTSIVSLGVVCTLYCFLGGLKAVLWTDVFQACLMFICVLSIFITGIEEGGGLSKVYETARAGHRLDNIFNPRLDFLERFNFWSCILRGFIAGIVTYGTNQLEVQRILSMSDVKRAKSVLRLSSLPQILLFAICLLCGIVLYGIYHDCDPVLNKKYSGLTKHDQMIPAYIVNKFSNIPGMTGLCIAGIFSASLSTISSALNCASTITVVDFIKPIFKSGQISDLKTVWLAKVLSLMYGVICIGLSFCFLDIQSLKRLSFVVISAGDGPILAIFLVGVLTRKAGDKLISFAFIFGITIISWISFGSLFSKYHQPFLPLSTSGCTSTENVTTSFNSSTIMTPTTNSKEIFILYKIAHMWYPTFGFILTSVVIFISVLATGWKKNVIPADSKCLSPILWKKSKPQNA